MEAKPLIVIVGPTASGKTSLAIEMAEKFNGEIICADSRTIYKGMDIGTAKPTVSERSRVRHWGLDLAEPNQRYTAANFQQYAIEKIEEVRLRGNVPFLVGGSGLYVDSVIFDYQFGNSYDSGLRSALEHMSLDELHNYCINNNIELPENKKNKRYIIRAIEQKSINKKRRNTPIDNTIIVGISTDKTELRDRISKRASQLIDSGVIEEAKILSEKYGWDSEAMTGNIYPLCRDFLENNITKQEMLNKFKVLDWKLSKRQLTWFKRNEYIIWKSLDEAKTYITDVLATEH